MQMVKRITGRISFKARYFVVRVRGGWMDDVMLNVAMAMPRRLLKWAFVVVAAEATTGRYGHCHPDDVSIMQALDAWEGK